MSSAWRQTSIGAGDSGGLTYSIPAGSVLSMSIVVYADSPEVLPVLALGPGCGSLPCVPMTLEIFPGQFAKFSGEF